MTEAGMAHKAGWAKGGITQCPCTVSENHSCCFQRADRPEALPPPSTGLWPGALGVCFQCAAHRVRLPRNVASLAGRDYLTWVFAGPVPVIRWALLISEPSRLKRW